MTDFSKSGISTKSRKRAPSRIRQTSCIAASALVRTWRPRGWIAHFVSTAPLRRATLPERMCEALVFSSIGLSIAKGERNSEIGKHEQVDLVVLKTMQYTHRNCFNELITLKYLEVNDE